MTDRLSGRRLLACLAASLIIGSAPAIAAKTAKQKPEARSEQPADDDTALDNVADAPPAPVLACGGPFAKTTSHAKLAAEFGEKNVVYKDVDGPEGRKMKATILFENDPVKQIVVTWRDQAARNGISSIIASAPSTWVGPGGIRNGLPLKQVEKLNGGVFNINGFEWGGGGFASGFKGPLASPPGGCVLSIRFEPGIANPLPKKFAAIVGDKKIPSSDRLMRRAKPMVSEWSVSYN
ncbi:MAG: hypothetical protein A4S14_10765 [Proteobacteria bacterium SG_bin9]|nr:MAG: hypothetical protein A4S14_10765 [Proteobacteria bacterium SG_bin9]